MMLVFELLLQGKKMSVEAGTSFLEFFTAQLGQKAIEARRVIAAKLNDRIYDLSVPITESGEVSILESSNPEVLYVIRHSMAHLLAHAVSLLWPNAKLTVGPPTEDGFFYDIDMPPISEEDLPKIEEKMKELVEAKISIERLELKKEELIDYYSKNDPNPYKRYMIENKVEEGAGSSLYKQADFRDLCMGPHVPNTKYLEAFKLVRFSNAYWLGRAENKSLTRIYGYGFADKKSLKDHINFIEEAKKRQHQKIGKDLDLFSFHDASPGGAFFHPKGATIYNELIGMLRREYFRRGFREVITPQIFKKELWERSQHWSHYRENMYLLEQADEIQSGIKPMNCPGHFLIYKSRVHSYRELPLRLADFTPLHRAELSGTLMGLVRVTKFSQDDAHIFCRLEQVESEIQRHLEFVDYIYTKVFDFKYHVEFSTRPLEKYAGSLAVWNSAERIIETTLKKLNIEYKLNPGDGAFYGPKIDFHLYDALGRRHQCGTFQLDFVQPENFDLTFVDEKNSQQRVVVTHRTVLGSLERFIGILVEHLAGKFPPWLAPEQVRVLGISDEVIPKMKGVQDALRNEFIRCEMEDSTDTLNKKIRNAQLEKVPYMVIIGKREAEANLISVRTREGKQFNDVTLEFFLDILKKKISALSSDLDFPTS